MDGILTMMIMMNNLKILSNPNKKMMNKIWQSIYNNSKNSKKSIN